MKDNVKIKICDVREPEVAQYCEEKGVSFLGIHQIKFPLTQEKRELLNQIRRKTNKIKLVLVTQENDFDKLLKLCLAFEWNYIQLHFKILPQDIIRLKDKLKNNGSNAGIISVVDIGQMEQYDIKNLSQISDFLLFDSSIRGGTGQVANLDLLKKIPQLVKGCKYFIAGGLNDKNVTNVIKICKPYAVDVQSGVEYTIPELKHKKDLKRIEDFVNAVNAYNINQYNEKER